MALWPRSMQVRRFLWVGGLTLFLVLPFVVRGFLDDTPKVCSVKRLTGKGCPGCGMTRSVCALSEGRFLDSIQLHAFGPVIYTLAALAWLYFLVGAIRKKDPFELPPKHTTIVWLTLFIGMVGYWVVRLAIGAVP